MPPSPFIHKPVRIALIGMGYRGTYLLKLLQAMPQYAEVVGIADPLYNHSKLGGIPIYNQGVDAYKHLIDREQPALVFIASPWQYHVEQAHYAMLRGCYTALEIKAGLTPLYNESEYQVLIELAERLGLKVYPLENTIFKREILAIGRMVEQGLFGKLLHMRGGYRHDLRDVLLTPEGNPHRGGEALWRYDYYERYNADIYPTHGFAPLALISGLGHRDKLKAVYSQGSACLGLNQRLNEHIEGNKPILSDIITTHITTEQGLLINLIHDTTSPRPRSLDWEIQGTCAVWDGERRRIYLEGCSPKETWEDDLPYIQHYEHYYWTNWGEEACRIDSHHQGMDYIMLKAIFLDLLEDYPYPATLRDLALWCSITPLSAQSLREQKVIQL